MLIIKKHCADVYCVTVIELQAHRDAFIQDKFMVLSGVRLVWCGVFCRFVVGCSSAITIMHGPINIK